MRRMLSAQAVAFIAAALVSSGALAQQAEGITVEAWRIDEAPISRTSSGVPVSSVAISHGVTYGDLDLSTKDGMAELKSRVHAAAKHGCRELSLAHRFTQPNDWLCTRVATREAMDQVQELVAAN